MLVVLESTSGRRLRDEEKLIATAIKESHFELSLSQLRRGRGYNEVMQADLVSGSVDFVTSALKIRGVDHKPISSYPSELRHLLHRNVSESELRHVLEYKRLPLFVKPSRRLKRFTGMVLEFRDDFRLFGLSNREPVWASDVVEFKSEFRVYVVNHQIRHIAHYEGDDSWVLDCKVVESAISLMSKNNHNPRSYAIDFGVLANGDTALVEVNEGYSIGAYQGLSANMLLELLTTRWQQITKGDKKC